MTAAERDPKAADEAAEPTGGPAEDETDEAVTESTAEEPTDEQATKPRARRRGAAETTTTSARRSKPKRDADGAVVVRARAKYVRSAPRKARLVIDHIRGKSVEEARAILTHTPRHAARDVLTLLNSCVANAENNHELLADELIVHQAFVDEGPTLKRYRPRALGRATRIRKRTSHMTIALVPKVTEE